MFFNIRSWFIFSAIGSYRSLHETLRQVTGNLFSYSHSIDCRYCDICKTDRYVPWILNRSQLFTHYSYSRGWTSAFFICWLDKRDEESKKRRERLTDHCDRLISEYNTYVNNNLRPIDLGWKGYLSGFRYNKEFLQHLHTGHIEVYDLLKTVIESEEASDESFIVVCEKLKERIRKETEAILEPIKKLNAREEDKPSFDEDAIAKHILTEIDDINTWQGFIFRPDKNAARHIVSINKWFRLLVFDQKRADYLVTTLNDIVRDSEISVDIAHYHNIRRTKEDKTSKFEQKLNRFIHGIELGTKTLEGACGECISLYNDKKEKKNLLQLLSISDNNAANQS
jgi:hypothetical protein